MKIGFFDSGAGGLEILQAVRLHMPQYDYCYYGDTAHVPFGDRSETEVYELTKAGVVYLFEQGALLVILACNTASAETARRLQRKFLPAMYPDRKILGVIIPTIETLIASGESNVTVLGTKRTIDSKKYDTELKKISGNVKLQSIPVPGLVPLIERGELKVAASELEQILESQVEEGGVVMMGCTHYSLLDKYIEPATKEKYTFLYQTKIIPKKLESYLENHGEIRDRLTTEGTQTVHFTGVAPVWNGGK